LVFPDIRRLDDEASQQAFAHGFPPDNGVQVRAECHLLIAEHLAAINEAHALDNLVSGLVSLMEMR
jgi:hypothetical protein